MASLGGRSAKEGESRLKDEAWREADLKRREAGRKERLETAL